MDSKSCAIIAPSSGNSGLKQTATDRYDAEKIIFALSQLRDTPDGQGLGPEKGPKLSRAQRALIQVIETPALPRATRKHALFWLGQSPSAAVQNYLATLLES